MKQHSVNDIVRGSNYLKSSIPLTNRCNLHADIHNLTPSMKIFLISIKVVIVMQQDHLHNQVDDKINIQHPR